MVDNPSDEVQVVWITTDGKRHQTAYTTRARADEVVVPGILTDYQGAIHKIWLQGHARHADGTIVPDKDDMADQNPYLAISRCPICGVWDGKGTKHDGDCLNG